MSMSKPIYIIDGARTPFLKARGVPGPFSASDLAVAAGNALLLKTGIDLNLIDETILGSVMPREDEANIGRLVGLRLGIPESKPGWTVQRNCASGMQSLDSAIKDITLGRSNIVLAGGAEAMSHAPILFNQKMVNWLGQMRLQKSFAGKLGTMLQWRPSYLAPVIALLKGLSDPLCNLNMGQTAEILAYEFHLTREDMDLFALQSHERAIQGQEHHHFNEVTPLISRDGKVFDKDDGVREDSSMGGLAKLRPFFDREFGLVTAGNSSQITDGACLLMLASEEAVNEHRLKPIGRIVDVEWAALSPTVMGLGPVMAATPLLQRHQLGLNDIDYWEINEAFAAQVLACKKAWQSVKFCRDQLGLSQPFGELDNAKLNVDGGAIALGHPVGASGSRIVLHLLDVLRRNNAKKGVASICIGGGQGGAMLVERI